MDIGEIVSHTSANQDFSTYLRIYTLQGHEICGTIVAFGKNARSMHPHLELGSRVAVYQVNACQLPTCPECGLGYENLCEAALGSGLGIGTDGGFADYVTLPARSLYLVPEGMDSSIAAVATDACTTGKLRGFGLFHQTGTGLTL